MKRDRGIRMEKEREMDREMERDRIGRQRFLQALKVPSEKDLEAVCSLETRALQS